MSSTPEELFELTRQAVVGLALALGLQSVQVKVRKLPKHQETVDDPLPLIAIVPSTKPDKDVPFDTGRDGGIRKLRTYTVQIVIIAAGNKDAISNLDVYQEWREQIANSFAKPRSVEHGKLLTTKFIPDVVIDRRVYSANYDYSGQAVQYSVVEVIPD